MKAGRLAEEFLASSCEGVARREALGQIGFESGLASGI